MQAFLTKAQRDNMKFLCRAGRVTLHASKTPGGKPTIVVQFHKEAFPEHGWSEDRYDTMTVENWKLMLDASGDIQEGLNGIVDAEKRIREENKAKARESLDTLRGILTKPAAIRAALEGEGYQADVVDEVMRETLKSVA